MSKLSTTVDEQIAILRERGMKISNEKKAREHLLDIGYYRLGFYWFPFEETFPSKKNRTHKFKEGTQFDWAVKLYYFDFDLRNLLLRYISRVEVNFRTSVVYHVSTAYKNIPAWYVNNRAVKSKFIKSDEYCRQISRVNNNEAPLIEHMRTHTGDRNAPAWKLIEYLTFGTLLSLYDNLTNESLRTKIAGLYGYKSSRVFSNHMATIKRLRNLCAHSNVMFDTALPKAIATKCAINGIYQNKTSLMGAILVLHNMLRTISSNRACEMLDKLKTILEGIQDDSVLSVIRDNSGINFDAIKNISDNCKCQK